MSARYDPMLSIFSLAFLLALFMGCSSPQSAPQPFTEFQEARNSGLNTGLAVADLNRQLEQFNAGRPGEIGITPIAQRVARVKYINANKTINGCDSNGHLFLVLKRQPDRQFKGTLKVPYHELPRPEGHSWGQILAEFTLPSEVYQPMD